MVTPIRPSLAQMLNGTAPGAPAPRPAETQAAPQAGGFQSALAAQKAFFSQVSTGSAVTGQAANPAATQRITPANFTAADIARAAPAPDPDAPPKRPGSFLNIVI